MRSRPGNGAPASVSSGSASAAASDTAPRMPVHERKKAPRQLDIASGDPLREVQHREDPGEAQHDHGEADERRVPDEPRRRDVLERVHHDGKLSPTSTNSSAFSRYWTISQTATPCRRTWAVVSSGVCHPR